MSTAAAGESSDHTTIPTPINIPADEKVNGDLDRLGLNPGAVSLHHLAELRETWGAVRRLHDARDALIEARRSLPWQLDDTALHAATNSASTAAFEAYTHYRRLLDAELNRQHG